MFSFIKIDLIKLFDNILKFIRENGKETILFLMLVFTFAYTMYMSYKHNQQLESYYENVIHTHDAEVYEKLYDILEEHETTKQDRHSELYMRRMEYSPQINAELRQYLDIINTDHIVVAEYHNGYTSISTMIPFCKYSITYETHKPSYNNVSTMFQSTNITPLLYTADMSTVTTYTTEEIQDYDEFLYMYFKTVGIERIYYRTISFAGNPCGFIVCANYSLDKISNENEIVKLAKEMETYLTKIRN